MPQQRICHRRGARNSARICCWSGAVMCLFLIKRPYQQYCRRQGNGPAPSVCPWGLQSSPPVPASAVQARLRPQWPGGSQPVSPRFECALKHMTSYTVATTERTVANRYALGRHGMLTGRHTWHGQLWHVQPPRWIVLVGITLCMRAHIFRLAEP